VFAAREILNLFVLQVYQDFDPSKFNFTKANPVETMFWTHIPVQEPRGKEEEEEESEAVPPHAVMVNVSPLYWGHSLLLPYDRRSITCCSLVTCHAAAFLTLKRAGT